MNNGDWTDLTTGTITVPPGEYFTLYDEDSNVFNKLRNETGNPILLSGKLAPFCWIVAGKRDTF